MPNLIGGILLGFTWQFIFVQAFEALGKATGDRLAARVVVGYGNLLCRPADRGDLAAFRLYDGHLYCTASNIPDNLLEAAEIDGANSWQKLRSITLPLVAPAFTVGLFLSLSNCFKLYDQNLALTNGGPFDSTEMIALNIYNTAFRYNDLGLAQAKAVIFLVIVAAIGLTQLYFSKRKEVEM